MKITSIHCICFALLMGLASIAVAQDKPTKNREDRQRPEQKQGDKKPNPEQLFSRLDQNQDGSIGNDELKGKLKERLANVDSNGDGKIDQTEFAAAFKNRADTGGPRGEAKPGGQRKGMDQDPAARVKMMLGKLDKNKDGKLSKDEMPERLAERAGAWDTSGDGAIDEKELTAVLSQLASKQRDRNPEGGAQKQPGQKGNRGGQGPGPQPQKPKRPAGA